MEEQRSWRKQLQNLREYAASHPELLVTETSLRIPRDLRPEFYAQVENVRRSLAGELPPELRQGCEEIAASCREVKAELCVGGLRDYRMGGSLERFFQDPDGALARPLFDAVLDALQKGLCDDELEAYSRELLIPHAGDLLRCAQELRAYYGVIAALKPVRWYTVGPDETLEPARELCCGWQPGSPDRRLPECVFETADGRVFAVKCESAEELPCYASKISKDPDSQAKGDTADVLTHRVMLIYELKDLTESPLLANREKAFHRATDLTLEFLLPQEMENPYWAYRFFERCLAVRSRRPIQLLTADETGAFPENVRQTAPFERSVVCADRSVLEQLAAKLLKA